MGKQVINRIIGAILFCTLLMGCMGGISAILDKPDVDEKYRQFFAEDKNIEVIFLGTSHTYNTVMPQEIWDEWGIPSYNFGHSNCTLPISYHVLRMLDAYTDPSLVVVDLFSVFEYAKIGNGKYRTDSRDQQRVQFDAFPLSKLKLEAVNDVFDDYEDRIDFLFKPTIYHNRWTELGTGNFKARNIPQKGAAFMLGAKAMPEYREGAKGVASELPPIGREYLERIVSYCEQHNIRVLFTFMPFVAEQESVHAAASFDAYFSKEYLALNPHVAYINMLNGGIIDYSTDVYTDASHLNYIGSAVVTDWLGGYIAEYYPDTICKEDPSYDSWNRDYAKYVDYKISRFTKGNLYENLQLLYGNDFTAELIVQRADAERFKSDTMAQNLKERLTETLKVDYTEEKDASYLTLKVTDCRTGTVVFETEIQ